MEYKTGAPILQDRRLELGLGFGLGLAHLLIASNVAW